MARPTAPCGGTGAGQHFRAVHLTRYISEPITRAEVLTELATAAARAGRHNRALRLARDIPDPYYPARALIESATAMVENGRHARALQFVEMAITTTCDIPKPSARAWTYAKLVNAMARACGVPEVVLSS